MRQLEIEYAERDEVLDRLAKSRKELVALARHFAEQLCTAKGSVTSPQVLQAMRAAGHGDKLRSVDARFMGVVFRGKTWERLGYADGGSHARPVSVWGFRK